MNAYIETLPVLLLGKLIHCVLRHKFACQNTSCNFINLPFDGALDIGIWPGYLAIRISWDSCKNPKKSQQNYSYWLGKSTFLSPWRSFFLSFLQIFLLSTIYHISNCKSRITYLSLLHQNYQENKISTLNDL